MEEAKVLKFCFPDQASSEFRRSEGQLEGRSKGEVITEILGDRKRVIQKAVELLGAIVGR